MSLREYKRKRHFQRTPEPAGEMPPARGVRSSFRSTPRAICTTISGSNWMAS